MLYDSHNNLEDRIVEELSDKRCKIKGLYTTITTEHNLDVTLRAVYKSVNQLIDSGVILKVGKEVLLNEEWVDQVREQLLGETPLFELDEGESATYTFTSLSHIDAYWKTVTNRLGVASDYPIFFYNPHDIWVHLEGRRDSEKAYYKSFEENEHYGFYVIGGTTALDKELRRNYRSDYFQINLRNISSIRETDHITIYERYVITVRLPRSYARHIDSLYEDVDSERELITKINNNPPQEKITFKVENAPKKARKLRKRLSKDFYIPRILREKYNPF